MSAKPLPKEGDLPSPMHPAAGASGTEVKLHSDEVLVLRVKVSAYDDDSLHRNCDAATIERLQINIRNAVLMHIPNASVHVSLHKGSFIVLITISAIFLVRLTSILLSALARQVTGAIDWTFKAVKGMRFSVDWKKVKEGTAFVLDILSIASKLIGIFHALGNLPPTPGGMDPDGWTSS